MLVILIVLMCINYWFFFMIKHHDQDNLQNKELVLVCGSRGIRLHHGLEASGQHGDRGRKPRDHIYYWKHMPEKVN